MKKLYLVSLGCAKNLVDSEVMLGKLRDYEITSSFEDADLIIVNTCGFIESAKSESIRMILEIHQKRKEGSLLVMAGCLSERYKNELMKELKEVDIFTGVGDYDKIDRMVNEKLNMFSEKTYLIKDEQRIITNSAYHAYIKISEGCNQNCSFCAIPNFKGKLQSRDIDLVVNEVKELTKRGYFDFSFVSQDSSSYLRDKNQRDGLINLIREIDKIDGVKSARILYLYPSTTTFELIDTIKSSKKFHNYFDIPIQHISNSMLKIMRRGFGEEKTKELLEYIKDDNSFIRTTFIVGHPNEGEEDFKKMYEFIKEFGFDRVNVFEYSNEEDTIAFNMPQLDKKVVKKRAKELEKLIKKELKAKLKSEIGSEIRVVIEKPSDESEYLLSAKNLLWAPDIDGEIYVNDSDLNEELQFGTIYKAKITDVVDDKQLATITERVTF